ncbi:MAG TPA: Kdo hydroxylase family protein [Steroidobacteraceae bacterium]|nr:Kdo hydroxylase family protein [Steroidobacteraceae bacterium]
MIEVLDARDFEALRDPRARSRARDTLENGRVLLLPQLSFPLRDHEHAFLDPANQVRLRFRKAGANGRPTLLYDQSTGRLRGGRPVGLSARQLRDLMGRYADWSRELTRTLLPHTTEVLEQEWTTFRPARRTATQNLHMDAAIARPTQGRCWLRIFRNVNERAPRVWQVGGNFEAAAQRAARRLPARVREQYPGVSALLWVFGVAKGRATAYDHTMRALREFIMHDKEFQQSAPRQVVEFPAGATWLAYTDLALHGAMAGQHSLDQSFLIERSSMRDPGRSSLGILERLTGRSFH